jgi:hypothetical protein
LRNRIAYVATEDGVRVCDLTDPAAPDWSEVIDEGRIWYEVEVQGDRLYAGYWGRMLVFDVAGEPEEVGGIPDEGVVRHFAADGAVGALARKRYGVTLFDLSPQGAPEIASTLELGAYANRVEVDGRWLYVGLYDPHGIAIVNVADPAAPVHVATMEDLLYYATDLAAEGGLLAVGLVTPEGDAEVRLIDVSVPDDPVVTFIMPLDFWYFGLDVKNGLVYVASRANLIIIDASDPTAPVMMSSTRVAYSSDDYGYNVAAITDLAYIDYGPYLAVIDISDPSDPTTVQVEIGLSPRWLAASDESVAGGLDSQEAFLTSRDQNGHVVFRSFSLSRESEGGAIVGGDLYVATHLWLEKVHLECRPPEVDFDWDRTGSWLWPEAHVGYGATSGTWDFGFGEPVEWSPFGVPPVHYPAPGAYDISLELENEWGSDRLTKTVIITPELGLSSPIRHPAGRVAP